MKKAQLGAQKPTKRQGEILDFIVQYQKKYKHAPSLAEIATHFKVKIPTVHEHVSALREKNLLSAKKGQQRSIQVMNNHARDLVEIPLMGIIAAGGPIEAIRNPEPIGVPQSMLTKGYNFYALRVSGTSMIEEGISDGDIVIVRQQFTVDDGEKAVAYLPDRDAVTLKKIYREKDRIKLVPANSTMEPFYETNVDIQGKVVGVLREEN